MVKQIATQHKESVLDHRIDTLVTNNMLPKTYFSSLNVSHPSNLIHLEFLFRNVTPYLYSFWLSGYKDDNILRVILVNGRKQFVWQRKCHYDFQSKHRILTWTNWYRAPPVWIITLVTKYIVGLLSIPLIAGDMVGKFNKSPSFRRDKAP